MRRVTNIINVPVFGVLSSCTRVNLLVPPLRILAGVLSIGVVVAAFAIYQVARPLLNAPSPATLPPTLIVLRPSAAPSATQPGPIFRIISDKAGLSTQLTELYYAVNADTWDLSHLGSLAGHLQGTANFGDGRNVVLAGHVELKDGVRGPFADLHRLAPGDPITILNDARPQPKVIQYTVTQVRKVKPDDFDVIRNHGYEELTLITCDDWNAQQSTYLSRIIVHARPVAALVTAGRNGQGYGVCSRNQDAPKEITPRSASYQTYRVRADHVSARNCHRVAQARPLRNAHDLV